MRLKELGSLKGCWELRENFLSCVNMKRAAQCGFFYSRWFLKTGKVSAPAARIQSSCFGGILS